MAVETVLTAIRRVFTGIPPRVWLSVLIVIIGFVLSYLVAAINRRILERAGVPESLEGTAIERTAREFGTSTVRIVAKLTGYFVLLLSLLVALTVAELGYADLFWSGVAVFLPQLFVAVAIVLIGVVVADKAELFVAERLRGIKLPEIGVVPTLVKYSILFIATLVALGQIGVATLALIVLLGAYLIALVVFTAIATHDLFASCAAGVYLLLNQPYGIGDEVRVAGQRGIVQEVDLFVTRIETDGEEHIIPNRSVFKNGIVRIRE